MGQGPRQPDRIIVSAEAFSPASLADACARLRQGNLQVFNIYFGAAGVVGALHLSGSRRRALRRSCVAAAQSRVARLAKKADHDAASFLMGDTGICC